VSDEVVKAPLLAQLQAAKAARAITPTSQPVGGPEKFCAGTPQAAGFDWEEDQAIQADLAYNADKAGRAHREHEARAMRLQMRYGTVDGQ